MNLFQIKLNWLLAPLFILHFILRVLQLMQEATYLAEILLQTFQLGLG